MKVAEAEKIVEFIDRVISAANDANVADVCKAVRAEVRELCLGFPLNNYGSLV